MLYGSRISKKKVFHYGDCIYARRTIQKNKLFFSTVEDAKNKGYKQCPCCSRIPKEYKKNLKTITDFCDKHSLVPILMGDELFIISTDDTAWRICMKGDGSKEKQLLHESKLFMLYDRRYTSYEKRQYHVQEVPEMGITGFLNYIYKHDVKEAKRKEKERIVRVNKALLREQVKSIQAVQKQIAMRNRKRSRRGPAESNAQKRRRSNQYLRNIAKSFYDYEAAAAAYI